ANADDLQKFDLEKSKDGISFNPIKIINKEGSRLDFGYIDENLLNPLSYYRLKITETNQHVYYSNIILLRNEMEKLVYKVYQDAENHQYHLMVSLNTSENISIRIVDANGKQIMLKNFGKLTGNLNYDINLFDKAGGIYFLAIYIGDKKYSVNLLAK
ncbi:MAG: T9SS type A sorting domain-containing protein, partial [Ferruginibacter sp.]